MPKPVTPNLDEVALDPERAKVKWGSKAVVSKMYSVNPPLLSTWLREMRDSEQFNHGVLSAGHKTTLIVLDVFEDFVRWKVKNRYKQKRR